MISYLSISLHSYSLYLIPAGNDLKKYKLKWSNNVISQYLSNFIIYGITIYTWKIVFSFDLTNKENKWKMVDHEAHGNRWICSGSQIITFRFSYTSISLTEYFDRQYFATLQMIVFCKTPVFCLRCICSRGGQTRRNVK